MYDIEQVVFNEKEYKKSVRLTTDDGTKSLY